MSSRRVVVQRKTGLLFLQTDPTHPEWKVLEHAYRQKQLSVSPVPYDDLFFARSHAEDSFRTEDMREESDATYLFFLDRPLLVHPAPHNEPFFAGPDAVRYILLGSVEWETADSISSLLDRVQSLLTASRHAARMLVYELAFDGILPDYEQEALAYASNTLARALSLLATPDGFWQWLEHAEQEEQTMNVNSWLETYLHAQGIAEARLLTTDTSPTLHIQHTEAFAQVRFQWIANLHHAFTNLGKHHERPVTIHQMRAVLPTLPTTYSLLPPPPTLT